MSVLHITKDNFEELVTKNKKVVLLDFWAPWCGPCRRVVPIVEEIAQERSDIKVGKINIEDEQALAREFRVMSIPTLLVVKNGQVVNRSVGVKSKSAILNML